MTSTRERIPITRPCLDGAEANAAREALASGFVVQGPRVAEFEALVADRVGARHALAVTSATTGLHLALVALGVGPDDEVLVSDFTFPASGNVVVHLGARPVLVDVRTDTYAIDVADLRAKLSDRTRAIVAVDPFGLPYDAASVAEVADQHGIPVVEDAACAIGGSLDGRAAGTLGTVGVFSFHGRKVITTGEGGMVVTDDDAMAERLALMRNHGGSRIGFRMSFIEAGFNYRMSDIAGAIGVAQMAKLEYIVGRRRELSARLRRRLADVAGLRLQAVPAGAVHTFQSFVVLLDEGVDRDAVVNGLARHGVESTIGTYALHAEPFYAERFGYRPGDLPGSAALGARSLTLPLYPGMADDDVDVVAEAVADVLEAG